MPLKLNMLPSHARWLATWLFHTARLYCSSKMYLFGTDIHRSHLFVNSIQLL